MTTLNSINHNVHESCGVAVARIQADIDSKVYDYFFKHVIAFTHGSRQALVCFFFQRFYEECQELGIPCVWDEDNAAKLTAVMNRLNFKLPNESIKTKKERPNKVLRPKV